MAVTFRNTNLPDIIDLKDISTSYDRGKSYIIKDFNLLIEDIPDQGEFIVVLGKSGCGKTTVLKYIAGLAQPYSGQILIHGKNREQEVPISMVFQEPSALEHYTVLKNVMLPLLYRGVSEEDARQPNFWAGNAVLPRVAQWKDVLIAVHHLPEGDWMGFTHAYFPTYAFNEYALRQGWAFARKENGYLALTAAHGLSLVRGGQAAYRELRSPGQDNIWLCHLGRAALDGDFATFQEKVLDLDIRFESDKVQCKTLRGESLVFGWRGPLLRDGKEVPLSGFPHYNNPYSVTEMPCNIMEIRFNEDLMRLDFTGLS